ncbi:dihydrolipoyllysine-residue acetyltransferase [Alteromonadaceae bacterium M269]|nr:dihydrolipoyllysine-residue acetyltransferase [Alteromonadaceae bacterium M269]
MMKDFILPDIGEGIIECEIVEWLVKEGDHIVEDQAVADVMTDKALVQIPAMYSGVVQKLYYEKGDIAKVHEPLFSMNVDGEASSQQVETPVEAASVSQPAEAAPATNDAVVDFILPDIGEGIVECELVEWLVEEGQVIEEDQAVADVMTDKALVQIPAKYSGKVVKLYYAKGDIAKVHTPLFSIARSDLAAGEVAAPVATAEAPKAEPTKSAATGGDNAIKSSGKALASPAVRRVAREMNIDLSQVVGSGKKGRVLKEDLLNFNNAASSQPVASAPAKTEQAVSAPAATISKEDKTVPIRGIQAAMARQMQDSVSTIPHFTVSDEIEMDALIAARKMLKPEFEKLGVKLSFMPFIIKALSLAMTQFPVINSRVNDDCSELTYLGAHNIGMAIDSKLGLLVPNIKNVESLSLFEVAKRAQELVELGREGRLASTDLKGGSVSISNIGTLGGTTATPVINKPEVAIVALGKMQKLPRFDENDQVKAVNIMHISWSGDHRVIDGATMVRFSNLWKSYLENPLKMLTELR